MMMLEELCRDAVCGIKDEDGIYSEGKLLASLGNIIREGMNGSEIRKSLIQVSLELTTDMEPDWQYVAAKMYTYELYEKVRVNRGLNKDDNLYGNFYELIKDLTDKKLYGDYILVNYSKEDILELEKEIKVERDFPFLLGLQDA